MSRRQALAAGVAVAAGGLASAEPACATGIPGPTGAAGGALQRGYRPGCGGAQHGREPGAAMGPAGDRRQQTGCGRHHRLRRCAAHTGRRLHPVRRRHGDDGRQPADQRQPALRPRTRPGAADPALSRHLRPARRRRQPLALDRRAAGRRPRAARVGQLCVAGQRPRHPCGDRIDGPCRAGQNAARAVQGCRRPVHRRGQRRGRFHGLQHEHRDRPAGARQVAAAGQSPHTNA